MYLVELRDAQLRFCAKLNTLNPNCILELYECVSVSVEVTVTKSSVEKHLAKEGYVWLDPLHSS